MANEMVKSSREITRNAQARKIALLLARARKQLTLVKHQVTLTGSIDEGRKQQVANLLTKIDNYKLQLIEMGFDPKEASKWAAEQGKTKRSTVERPRGSGVGMYGLGGSVKVWR